MNFSQNPSVPQMVNSALQCTNPSWFVGKVVRLRPNIYVFVCDYCMSEHRSIDNFLRHCESHFERNDISNAIPSPVTPVQLIQNPSFAPSMPAAINSNGSMAAAAQAAPYPVQLQQSQFVPVHHESGGTDEVYEIIDLGYDFDGNYPNAQNIDAIPIDDENRDQQTKSKQKQKQTKSTSKIQRAKPKGRQSKSKNADESANQNASHRCLFCVRTFNKDSILKQHLVTAHAKILKKIDTSLKKAYKCKICGEKFSKGAYLLDETYEHLKIHYNN